MLARFVFVTTIFALFAGPARAGTVMAEGGKIAWQSTQCSPPAAPPSLSKNPEMRANDMNARVTDYNNFTQAAQAYSECVSREAEHDANAASEAIVAAAQATIDGEQKEVAALGAPLGARPPAE